MKQTSCVILAVLALAACAKTQPAKLPMTPSPAAGYHSYGLPASVRSVVQPIDTKRYSKMHITQSSYLFQ